MSILYKVYFHHSMFLFFTFFIIWYFEEKMLPVVLGIDSKAGNKRLT